MYKSPNISLKTPSSSGAERYYSVTIKDMLIVEPAEFKLKGELIVMSLSEDSFLSFRRKLLKHGIIDTKYHWLLRDTHLVILARHLERDDIVDCLWLIYSLEEKAKRSGGYVHLIPEKSSVLNTHFRWRSLHPIYAAKSGSAGISSTALFQGNLEIWNWLKTKNVMEKIGNFLFLHGGISRDILDMRLTISEINAAVRYNMGKNIRPVDDGSTQTVVDGMFPGWMYEDQFQSEESQRLVKDGLEQYMVSGIIYGNPLKHNIVSFLNGSVVSIGTVSFEAGHEEMRSPILKYTKNGLEIRVLND